MSCIAVIPARGGSKRIPGKNIREFCGRPIIAYSIDAARESGVFERILVSTDSDDIARVASDCGAEVPFMRPTELADDFTTTVPVIRHAVKQLAAEGGEPEYVCCIYATAPLIRAADINAGLQALSGAPDAEFAFPVTNFGFPIYRALKIDDGRVSMFWPEHEQTRSQDLEEAWHDAGQFYWGRRAAWLGGGGVYSSRSLPIPVPRQRVQDIDTEDDWRRAELMFRAVEAENGDT